MNGYGFILTPRQFRLISRKYRVKILTIGFGVGGVGIVGRGRGLSHGRFTESSTMVENLKS
jgi:hypothetical protein